MTMDWIMFSQVFVGSGGGVGISGPIICPVGWYCLGVGMCRGYLQ